MGSKDVLAKACVPVVVDLPGVGENYQGGWASNISFAFSFPRLFFLRWSEDDLMLLITDHQSVTFPYRASDHEETLDELLRGNQEVYSSKSSHLKLRQTGFIS